MPSWKDFATEKNPQTETDKFLVASLWTQTHGAADPFTGGHLFTCFRAMDWKTQVDMIQPLRADEIEEKLLRESRARQMEV